MFCYTNKFKLYFFFVLSNHAINHIYGCIPPIPTCLCIYISHLTLSFCLTWRWDFNDYIKDCISIVNTDKSESIHIKDYVKAMDFAEKAIEDMGKLGKQISEQLEKLSFTILRDIKLDKVKIIGSLYFNYFKFWSWNYWIDWRIGVQ